MNSTKFNIAVLIDGDNAQPKLISSILEEVSKYGKATIRRIYGDWTIPQMNGWKDLLNNYSFNPIQKFNYTTGKNSTDSSLIIDAMDILHSEMVQGFCIVSSDSDYTGLAKRIREEGVFVMGIGEKKTPNAFIQSCEIFTYTENIENDKENQAANVGANVGNANNSQTTKAKIPVDLKLINKAFKISQNEEDEAYISTMGNSLRKIDPSFDSRAHGFSSLTKLFESLKKYEVVKTKTGDPIIRLKQ